MALTWTNLGPRRSHIETQSAIATAIPSNNPTGITRTFNLTAVEPMRLEHVLLSLGITHQRRGDLDIRLTAPSGISDVFFVPHNDVNPDLPLNFPLLSVRHWGENIQGTWTVTVSDRTAANTGTLNDLRLEFFGTRGTPLAATPVITSPAAVTGQQNAPSPIKSPRTTTPPRLPPRTCPRVSRSTPPAVSSAAVPRAPALHLQCQRHQHGRQQKSVDVSLNLDEPVQRTFAQFRQTYLTPEQLDDPDYIDAEDDPDRDGVSNLLEFAFGGQPVIGGQAVLPRVTSTSGTSWFEYRVDTTAGGIRVTPQYSDSLQNTSWTDAVPNLHSQAGTIQVWRVALPASGVPRRFYRVEVETSPPRANPRFPLAHA